MLEPSSGAVLAVWTARRADGYDWFPYRGIVGRNEHTLFISYHGPDTTGIDSFTVLGGRLHRCHATFIRPDGCIAAHGNIELYGNGLLAATGGGPIHEINAAGKVWRDVDTHLQHNHLLEFTVDHRTNRLYAVGSCIYAGGFSAVDIGSDRARILVQEPNYDICGERLALASRSLLVLARTQGVIPQIGVQGQLLFLDTRTGQVQRSIPTPAEPVDVLVSARS
jgi:hypothetical protein